jgi:hypothetical protein
MVRILFCTALYIPRYVFVIGGWFQICKSHEEEQLGSVFFNIPDNCNRVA